MQDASSCLDLVRHCPPSLVADTRCAVLLELVVMMRSDEELTRLTWNPPFHSLACTLYDCNIINHRLSVLKSSQIEMLALPGLDHRLHRQHGQVSSIVNVIAGWILKLTTICIPSLYSYVGVPLYCKIA